MKEAGTGPQDTALLPESPYFWATEQVPCLALSIRGTVTQFQEQGCSMATSGSCRPACATPGTIPSTPWEHIQMGQKLAAATFSFSNPAYEKLDFMVVILHIRRNWPQFLLDRIGLEQ